MQLCEAGTHAVIDAAMGPSRFGEPTLAEELVRSLQTGMLCIADRGFCSFKLFQQARTTGTDVIVAGQGEPAQD